MGAPRGERKMKYMGQVPWGMWEGGMKHEKQDLEA